MNTPNSFKVRHVFTSSGNGLAKTLCSSSAGPNKAHGLRKGLTACLAIIAMFVDFKP
ncbi:hypothetical protein D3C86_2065000 [compost metagenome]